MRLMLDNNVWTYLAVRDLVSEFESIEDALPTVVHVVAPSLLLEAARTGDVPRRDSILRAMAARSDRREHPPTEAKQQAAEIIQLVAARRPSWIALFPSPSTVRKHEVFWTRKVWQIAMSDPERLARTQKQLRDTAPEVSAIQRENQAQARSDGFHLRESEAWVEVGSIPEAAGLGLDAERVEAWRAELAILWWHHLAVAPRRGHTSTLADWVRPWVDLKRLAGASESWYRLWLTEVEATEVPRNWLGCALPWAQMQGKLGDGDPRDAQHAAYLFDIDLFVTADRRYARALNLARDWSSTPFAAVEIIPGSGNTAAHVREAVSSFLKATA